MRRPTLRERLKPLELVGFAAALAAFAFLVVLLATKQLRGAAILAGIAFIVALLVLAMLALAAGDPEGTPDGRAVLDRHDGEPDPEHPFADPPAPDETPDPPEGPPAP